jgi:hypothetical protein
MDKNTGNRFSITAGLAVMGLVAVLTVFGAPNARADTPYEQAKGVVQEMLGEAITYGALAETREEKGRYQEQLGYAIMNQAMIDLGERDRARNVETKPIRFVEQPEAVQELLGQAIVDATLADTADERGRTQEILGMLIVNKTLLEFGEMPIGVGGDEAITD